MKYKTAIIIGVIVLILSVLAGCNGPNYENTEDREPLPPHGYLSVGHIEFMNDNLYSRVPFSYRELEAAEWIFQELLTMGHPEENVVMQEFSHAEVHNWRQMSWEMLVDAPISHGAHMRPYSQNVILTIPGQGDGVIVVGAHYDTLPYPGASDNASGTALLLESAQRILDMDNYHTIVYVFFGAEEIGLLGAYFFHDSLSQQEQDDIILMINADVLFEGPYLIYGAGDMMGSNDISRQINVIAQGIRDAHDIEISTVPTAVNVPSDHLIFLWEGHTVVYLGGMYKQPAYSFTGFAVVPYDNYVLTGRVLHTYKDCIHYINVAWPGKIDRAMRTFSIFLEEMLLAVYN